MKDTISVGNWIKKRRAALGFTQVTFAKQLGCSPETIRKIEQGKRRPSRQIASLLAEHLAIPAQNQGKFIEAVRSQGGLENGYSTNEDLSRQLLSVPHNLPASPTPFIGREEEIALIEPLLLNPSNRLISIIAGGGMGKSRLAIAVAKRQLQRRHFPDGIFFVPLAPLSSAARIVPAVAQIVGLKLQGEGKTPANLQLLNHLRSKKMLLLFDNFEHLLEGAHLLGEMMHNAPQMKLLVTSRERLNLYGEHLFHLQGMAVTQETDAGWRKSAAAQLFVQSGKRAKIGFKLTEANRAAFLKMSKLVAGMPLALELAGGWVDTLSLDQILAQLEASLNILASQASNVPARHRSMRAMWQGVWLGLAQSDKRILRQLSLFRGGFTLSAAEEIARANHLALPAFALYFAKNNQPKQALATWRQALAQPFVANSKWHQDVVGKALAALGVWDGVVEEMPAVSEADRVVELWQFTN